MPEIKKEIKSYSVDYVCDQCEIGNLLPTGLCLTSMPPKFPHICNYCNAYYELSKRYPKIIYE